MPPLNACVDADSGFYFDQSVSKSMFRVYEQGGCGESVHMHRLAIAFVAQQRDKNQTLMRWLTCKMYNSTRHAHCLVY